MTTNKKKVLILGPMHADGMALFDGRDDVEAEVLHDISPENIIRHIPGVHGVGVPVSYTHLRSPRDRTRSRMPSSA